MDTSYIAICPDDENNACEWWDALDERYPALATVLRRQGQAVIRAELWDALAALPGFADGPEYANCALLDLGSEGEQWAEAVAGRHQVFDTLS